MKRLLASGVALVATLALAACGGGGGGSSSSSTPASSSGAAVSVKSINGVGNVLVDSEGKALYASDEEASGKVLCTTGACMAFWKPLTTDTAKPTASSDAGKIGVIKRPDGAMQVAVDGRPLYTFSEDSPGKATGDGFTDDFSGHHFVWHVVSSSGDTSSGSGSQGAGNSGKGDYGY